ncbi:multiple antibiotic resistance protein [Pararobbsia alpina]|jgi:MarC family membrane protein|uniref:MarC family protein n=1 Tax=Pararobbsia alpina TaxID=621374 RepID=UPI0039A5EB92
MEYNFLSATILLVLITDPIGNIPIFINALKRVPVKRRPTVIIREVAIAFGILVAFMLGGRQFLQAMHLSDLSMRIGGGIVLFLIALRMVFPHPDGALGGGPSQAEPLIVPLAIPAIAGPSAIATVMLLASQAPDKRFEWLAALTVTMLISGVVLLASDQIQNWLGERAVAALERLMGLVLIAISVDMLLEGIRIFVRQLSTGG